MNKFCLFFIHGYNLLFNVHIKAINVSKLIKSVIRINMTISNLLLSFDFLLWVLRTFNRWKRLVRIIKQEKVCIIDYTVFIINSKFPSWTINFLMNFDRFLVMFNFFPFYYPCRYWFYDIKIMCHCFSSFKPEKLHILNQT